MSHHIRIFVLVCTIDEGITSVKNLFLPEETGVTYVVAWQRTHALPSPDFHRTDVVLATMEGRGLSRNRNLAMQTAVSLLQDQLEDAIFVVADDDEKLDAAAFHHLRTAYAQRPRMDIALMRVRSINDQLYFKPYPQKETDFRHRPRYYYPCSWEITFRSRVWHTGLRFDERFGLGSDELCAGEEDIFLTDALRRGLRIQILPIDLGWTDPVTTGDRTLDTLVLKSKGAVYGYSLSLPWAFVRTAREALSLAFRNRVSPFRLFRDIWQGVKYIRQ